MQSIYALFTSPSLGRAICELLAGEVGLNKKRTGQSGLIHGASSCVYSQEIVPRKVASSLHSRDSATAIPAMDLAQQVCPLVRWLIVQISHSLLRQNTVLRWGGDSSNMPCVRISICIGRKAHDVVSSGNGSLDRCVAMIQTFRSVWPYTADVSALDVLTTAVEEDALSEG